MSTLADIARIADSWVGTPFTHQGRSRQGTDCVGHIYLVGVEGAVDLRGYVDNPTYGRDPDGRLEELIGRYLLREVPRPLDPPPGVILFFKFGRKAQHLGIMSQDFGKFVHAHEPDGKVMRTRLDRRWQRFLTGVYRFHGLEN